MGQQGKEGPVDDHLPPVYYMEMGSSAVLWIFLLHALKGILERGLDGFRGHIVAVISGNVAVLDSNGLLGGVEGIKGIKGDQDRQCGLASIPCGWLLWWTGQSSCFFHNLSLGEACVTFRFGYGEWSASWTTRPFWMMCGRPITAILGRSEG